MNERKIVDQEMVRKKCRMGTEKEGRRNEK